jgi:hypothetical protein
VQENTHGLFLIFVFLFLLLRRFLWVFVLLLLAQLLGSFLLYLLCCVFSLRVLCLLGDFFVGFLRILCRFGFGLCFHHCAFLGLLDLLRVWLLARCSYSLRFLYRFHLSVFPLVLLFQLLLNGRALAITVGVLVIAAVLRDVIEIVQVIIRVALLCPESLLLSYLIKIVCLRV